MIHCHIVLVLCYIVQFIRAECDYSDRIACYLNFAARRGLSWSFYSVFFKKKSPPFILPEGLTSHGEVHVCCRRELSKLLKIQPTWRHQHEHVTFKWCQDTFKLPKRATQSRNTMFSKERVLSKTTGCFQRTLVLPLSTGRIYGFHKNYVKRRCFYLANRIERWRNERYTVERICDDCLICEFGKVSGASWSLGAFWSLDMLLLKYAWLWFGDWLDL